MWDSMRSTAELTRKNWESTDIQNLRSRWLALLIVIFARDVVFEDFVRPDFALIRIGNVFHSRHNFRLE